MIKTIKKKGVRKSANDVMNGIKKLLGSFPLLNNNIELMNNDMKKIMNNNNTVRIKIIIIKKGLKISIPIVIAKVYPNTINTPKLNKIVISNPRKFSFRERLFLIFGGTVPIYKPDVSRDTKTVEISPIKEFNDGNIKSIIGIVYKIS